MLDNLALKDGQGNSRAEEAWGPVFVAGGTRFRLWAPAQQQVKLRLSGDHAMTRSDDGWFDVFIDHQPFGETYGFVLDDGRVVADPASRQQLGDVFGPSVLTDPRAYTWENQDWRGRPWHETLVQEIHIGTFTEAGTFAAAAEKLEHIAQIGITAVEIMPLAHFPGSRGWGYDGVLQYAPHSAYGSPDDLKAFVDKAHGLDLMVFLDVVYNHFGPEGNFLGVYAPEFFREGQDNDWGAQIDFSRQPVRRYFIDNAIHWLREYHLDGLRLDAVDAIKDETKPHILEEISSTVRRSFTDRQVHLMIENPPNGTDLLTEGLFIADWNDGFHHVIRRIATGETSGIFEKFADHPFDKLRKIMSDGYLEPGEPIVGTELPPSECLPPTAFIHFLQNHDQVGNRAMGDRLHMTADDDFYRALTAMLILSPQVPLLFMGDTYKDERPFHFFSDYTGELAKSIRDNRPPQAENFGGYPEGKSEKDIPDPNAEATFEGSKLDWAKADTADGKEWSALLRRLIEIRRETIMPWLPEAGAYSGRVVEAPDDCVFVDWKIGSAILQLRLNLSDQPVSVHDVGERIWPEQTVAASSDVIPRSVSFFFKHP